MCVHLCYLWKWTNELKVAGNEQTESQKEFLAVEPIHFEMQRKQVLPLEPLFTTAEQQLILRPTQGWQGCVGEGPSQNLFNKQTRNQIA